MNRRPQLLGLQLLTIVAAAILGAGVALKSAYAIVAIPAALVVGAAAVWPLSVGLAMVGYLPLEGFILKLAPAGAAGALSAAPELLLFVAAISAVARSTQAEGYRSRERFILWIAAFVLLGLWSAWLGGVPWIWAIYWLRTVIRYMSLALIVGGMGDREWWIRRLAPVVAVSIIIQTLVGFVELIGGGAARAFFSPATIAVAGTQFVDYSPFALTGVHGTLGFYTSYGIFSVVAGVLCAGAMASLGESGMPARSTLHLRRLFVTGLLAAVAGVLIAGARQAVVAAILAALTFVLGIGISRVGRRIIPYAFGLLVFAATALLLPQVILPLGWLPTRFAEAISQTAIAQSLASDRLFGAFRVAPSVIADRPIFGMGPGAVSSPEGVAALANALSLKAISVPFIQDVGWVGLTVQMGLVGLAAVVGLFLWIGVLARRYVKSRVFDDGALTTVLAALVAVSVGMLAGSTLFVRSISALLWCSVGLALGGYRRREIPAEEDEESA